ncbi:MAG: DUF3131 domain-containing protein [Candidatus Sericytochromatia bacterium]
MKKIIILFIFSLILTIFSSCGLLLKSILEISDSFNNSFILRQGQHGELTKEETDIVKIAWKYFENNNSESGIPAFVDKENRFSSWDISSYLSALISANKLELINKNQFDERISKFLYFLNTMPLYKNNLPNKFYNTNGKMLNKEYKLGETGFSFSDIGRLLIWLKILKNNYPIYSEYVDKAVLRWDLCELIENFRKKDKYSKFYNDGFYIENYSKKGFLLWGINIKDNYEYKDLTKIKINDFEIFHEIFNIKNSNNIDAVYSYPFILEGLEFNWDKIVDNNTLDSIHTDMKLFEIAQNIYKIQENRYLKENILTAKDNFIINKEPFYLYDTIFAEGYNWNIISFKGDFYSNYSLVSTKASFGLWSLWKTDYTKKILEIISSMYDPQKGWYEGRYEKTASIEKTISLETNSLILEAFLYKKFGKIYQNNNKVGYYENALKDDFKSYSKACFK